MNRRIAGAVTMLALAASAVLGAGPASAACPNEAFRTGFSALLEECRAYEMVTPVDKEGGVGVLPTGNSYTGTGDDGIYFHSLSAYAGAEGSYINSPYVALRGAETWTTRNVGGRQSSTFSGNPNTPVIAVSPDLSKALVPSLEALAPGGTAGNSNLYVRDNQTGTYSLVISLPGQVQFQGWASPNLGLPFVAASNDWSTILLYFAQGAGLYEFRDDQLRLVVPGSSYAAETEAAPNQMSDDGSSFVYIQENRLYLHRDGQEPLLVSKDEDGNPISGGTIGQFSGATPDDGIVFFNSEGSIWRFEAAAPGGGRTTRITPPTAGGESPRVFKGVAGEDGTHVYFTAGGLLTPDAEPVEGELGFYYYAWEGEPGEVGQIRYLGKTEAESVFEAPTIIAYVSPNGRFLGFESFGQVTPDAVKSASCRSSSQSPGACRNTFLYSSDDDLIACVTCVASPLGDSRLGGSTRIEGANRTHAVLDDGTVLFDTPNALVSRDSNGTGDAYAWRGGRPQLISSGTYRTGASYIDASADGSNVYFATEQPLVGQDVDPKEDLYDARIDGGLPQAGPVSTPCVSESGCRGGDPSGASASPTPGTTVLAGVRNVAPGCSALQGKARAARKRAKASMRAARRASDRRADVLRAKAARQSKAARRLGRRAGNCSGGGR